MIKKVIALSPVSVSFVADVPTKKKDFTCLGRYCYGRVYRECIEVRR